MMYIRRLRRASLWLTIWTLVARAETQPIRIWPLGDSRTAGPSSATSYRLHLDRILAAHGYSYDFVGTRRGHTENDRAPDTIFDADHNGMWGWTSEFLLRNPASGWEKENIGNWGRRLLPDITLVLVGTPDIHYYTQVSVERRISDIVVRMGRIIDTLRAVNPNMVILFANNYEVHDSIKSVEIETLNSRMPALIEAKVSPTSPLILVDMWSEFGPRSRGLLTDPIHANRAGCMKMADLWFAAMRPFLGESSVRRLTVDRSLAKPNYPSLVVNVFAHNNSLGGRAFTPLGRALESARVGTRPSRVLVHMRDCDEAMR